MFGKKKEPEFKFNINSVMVLFGCVLLVLGLVCMNLKNSSKPTYKTYLVNNGRDVMVRLPSGRGMNSKLSKEDATSLIENPRAGISELLGEEILDFISYRDSNK